MSMMGPPGGMNLWRNLRADKSVVNSELPKGILWRILQFARPHRRLILAFLVVTIFDSMIVVVNPLLTRHLIDGGILGHRLSLVWQLAGAMAAVAVLDTLVLGLAARYLSARIGEGLIFDLRTAVFAHVQRQSLAFFTRTQTGALVSRLNTDVIGAQRAFTSTLTNTLGNLISVVVVGIALFALSWQVTLACLMLFPVLWLTSRWVGGQMADLSRRQMDGNAAMGAVMTERFNVGGAMLLKLFGRRADEDALYAAKADVMRVLGVKVATLTGVFVAVMSLVPALATAVAYGVGGWLVLDGHASIGTLTALAALMLRLLTPLQSLSNVRVDVMTALVSFDRVFEILDLPSLVQEKADAVAIPAGDSSVRFRHVAFTYPSADEVSLASLQSVARTEAHDGRSVLVDIDFHAAPGELVALVGPSGAGKTTITHLLARLYDASEGAVVVGGVDVRDASLESLEAAVGYVTQDAYMFHDTIRVNLAYARPDATDDELWASLKAAQVAELVERLPDGLDTVIGDRGYRLSGGERQRLAIARLLLKAPRIVVLDEATAHLDSESEAAVQRALEAALVGRTSLVIAHRLSTIRNADQILVVDDGRIVQRGTHEELLASGGLYADLHRTQFRD
ncbi:ABC transporter [Nocardioides baekrokdamisoli]|uniref:ABC transporter n=2 Tax=Nocardioides baekrokdamisoli TaxID=1804624 RepID=A0A3G9IX94_9ACTN|nr:ABC transporter [Nocardioides baekrokdamisoli]